ncbi:hypothetical protein AVEN_226253-1 [Araneus ventricosus]|uniref:Uncharacterized protein n=1 Tax=Araneus ventricosus TaxID=182803 RepID=A0A4Y2TR31_ARAVE|nr:hypothetical protein AVEN_226253-1 [Araneus ventricosus]
MVKLVILTPRFDAKRGLTPSIILNNGQMTRETLPSPTSAPHQWEVACHSPLDLATTRFIYTANLWRNWVSNLEPSHLEFKALPAGYCGSSALL